MIKSFREVIEIWPSPEALAEEVGAKIETVRKWKQRDSIPAEWWVSLVSAAHARDADLAVYHLAKLAARKAEAAE